jgi:hypothetical protein
VEIAGFEFGVSELIAGFAVVVSLVTLWRSERHFTTSSRGQKAARFIYQNGKGFSGGNAVDSMFHNIGPHDAYSVEVFVAEPELPRPELSRTAKVPSGAFISTTFGVTREYQETSADWSMAYQLCYLDGNGPRMQTFRVGYSRNPNKTWKAASQELKKKPWQRDLECRFG